MVPGYYPRTILVNLPVSELLLGSLQGPEIAKKFKKNLSKRTKIQVCIIIAGTLESPGGFYCLKWSLGIILELF